ncbi:hypothetical protein WBJ53_14870 [Spirosoma sp. SC4-14]|uniref:hypothetical protein n=1 Tax=Spirosoma sp. SC4-14 TaxID=3128900 RepID=UPI0030D4427C
MTNDEKKALADQIRNSASELNALLNLAYYSGLAVRAWDSNDPIYTGISRNTASQIEVEIKEVTITTF